VARIRHWWKTLSDDDRSEIVCVVVFVSSVVVAAGVSLLLFRINDRGGLW
jgi:hypothetical protein